MRRDAKARKLALAERLETLSRITVPPAFGFLNESARYIVSYGGRGSGKSWSICRRLLREAYHMPIRVLCAREIQLSIEESVHHLIASQIDELGLSDHFEVLDKRISSRAGASFVFAGLRSNVSKLMSMEGIDRVWIEEAASISKDSWEKLIPTIRRPGSQIFVSFNPDLEGDATYQRFIVKPPPDAIVRKVSFRDNPFFPEELRKEKDYLASVDPDAYAHVWEGECRSHSDAQVFKNKFAIEGFEPAEDWNGPYFGADWGFSSDPTALVKCWIGGRKLYIEFEAYGVGVDIDKTPALFDTVPDARRHTIRADNARPETISYMRQHGFPEMAAVEKGPGSVEDGIAFLRQFEQIIVHPRCTHVADEMRLYSFKVDRLSGDVMPDILDKNNHTIDALRYALEPIIKGNSFQGWLDFLVTERVHNDKINEHRAAQPTKLVPREKPQEPLDGGPLMDIYLKNLKGMKAAYPEVFPEEVCGHCQRPLEPGVGYISQDKNFHPDCFTERTSFNRPH